MLSFAAPAFLWALAALPVVVWLHLSRRRRQPRQVAGLFLWRRAQERAARRPRPRPSWLLLLQLLAVAALAVALAGPRWTTEGPPDRVLVVDASASMAAHDPDGVRLEKAREAAEPLLAGPGRAAVVRMGREAQVVHPADDRDAAVRAALAELRAGDDRVDAARALSLARGLAGDGGEVHWLSDTPPPSRAGRVVVHDLAGEGHNLGIVSFDVAIGGAYLALASSYPGPHTVLVELLRGGDVIASTESLVPAAGRIGVSLPVEAGAGVLQARVTPPGDDALALDDEAWAGARTLAVALDRPFPALERALGAIPGVRVRVGGAAPADLRVVTGRRDAVPDGLVLSLPDPEAEGEAFEVVDWRRADPLLRFVQLTDVAVRVPDGAVPETGEVLVRGAAGEGPSVPLITRETREDGTVWRFAFHPQRSELVLRPAFPALVVNLMRALQGEARVTLGEPLPSGATFEGEPVSRALEPGPYRVGEDLLHASLLAEDETRLPAPTASGTETEPGAPAAEAGPERATSLVPPLLALALAALLLEWWWWSGARLGLPGTRARSVHSSR